MNWFTKKGKLTRDDNGDLRICLQHILGACITNIITVFVNNFPKLIPLQIIDYKTDLEYPVPNGQIVLIIYSPVPLFEEYLHSFVILFSYLELYLRVGEVGVWEVGTPTCVHSWHPLSFNLWDVPLKERVEVWDI